MAAGDDHSELIGHLTATSRLTDGEARRIVAEVLAYFSESTEEYVRRRHRELQRHGLTNPVIFEQVGRELAARRVAAPELSPRQLRRLVYG